MAGGRFIVLHRNLSNEKWYTFPKQNQILMIADEINRAGHWMGSGDSVANEINSTDPKKGYGDSVANEIDGADLKKEYGDSDANEINNTDHWKEHGESIAHEKNREGHRTERFDPDAVRRCDERAFELIDLTAEDPKWKGGGLGELLRFRELLAGRYASESMDFEYNWALMRILLQMHPKSAKAISS